MSNKLCRYQRPKKSISSGFRPNRSGQIAHYGKDGKIINQKGAFGRQ